MEFDFYKFLNNISFGIDWKNNIDNCSFGPIYDEISKIAYIKDFDSIFCNEKYRDFSDKRRSQIKIQPADFSS